MRNIIVVIIILIFSSSVYTQWVSLNSGTSQNLNTVYFIDIQTGYAAGFSGTMIKTTNSGMNWTSLNTGSSVELRSAYFFNPSTGLVCGFSGTILKTTNGGDNWSVINSGTTSHLTGLSFYGDSVGVCSGNMGTILYTTNGGDNWAESYPQGYFVSFYSAFMVDASTGYCVGVNTIFSPLVAKTINGGVNWVYSSFMLNNNEGTLRDLHFFNTQNGIAVSNLWNNTGGISRTTNAGANWSTQLYPYGIYGIDFPIPTTGFAVGLNGYILKSTDGGSGWLNQTSGTTVFLKAVDFIDSVNGYTVGDGGTILKTTNGGVTAIPKIIKELASSYKLYQNYPNPFNPTTTISFGIPYSSHVKLKIYDALSRKVATLVDEKLGAGSYEVEWDGNDYPSGVYFYILTTNEFSDVKKMVLIR